MEKKKTPLNLKRLRGQNFDFVHVDVASTWVVDPSDMEYTDPEFTAQIMESLGIPKKSGDKPGI